MTTELKPVKPDTAEVLIITGMSGAGRTTAAHSLEDLGWYVVDNLPPQLFSTMAQLIGKNPDTALKLALVVDVRSKEFFESLREAIDRKSTRLNSSHVAISYAVFCLKKKRHMCH